MNKFISIALASLALLACSSSSTNANNEQNIGIYLGRIDYHDIYKLDTGEQLCIITAARPAARSSISCNWKPTQ